MTDPTLSFAVEASWTTNPDDAPSWETVSVVESASVKGRGRSYEQDTVNPTTASIRVDNTSGDFTPDSITASGGTVTTDKPMRLSVTLNPGSTYRLFTGTVEKAPQTLDGDGYGYASTSFTCTDYLDALSSVTLRSAYIEATLTEGPSAFFTFGDKAASTSAGDDMGGLSGALKSASNTPQGAAAFEADPLLVGVDPTTCLSMAPATSAGVSIGGKYVEIGNGGRGAYLSGTSYAVRQPFATADTFEQTLFCQIGSTSIADATSKAVIVKVDSTGAVVAQYPKSGGVQTLTSSTGYNDGLPHMAMLVVTPSMSRLIVDGVSVATSSTAPVAPAQVGPVAVGATMYAAGWGVSFFSGRIGHVALFGSTYAGGSLGSLTAHYDAALGYPGESVATRIGRVLTWAGYTGTPDLDAGDVALAPQACAGVAASKECIDTAQADQGFFYIKADGTPRFRGRSDRYAGTSLVTFGTDTLPVDSSALVFDYDRQHMVNDLQATRPNGPVIRLTDATSISKHRRRNLGGSTITFNTQSDSDLMYAAQWWLWQYAEPRVRIGSIRLRPFTSPQLAQWAASLEPGDRITVTNLPDNAPAATMEFLVEGVGHPKVDPSDWLCELALSPFVPVALFDDATYGRFAEDTGAMTLHFADINSTDAGFYVAVPLADMTTDSGDWPFYITLDSEDMLVTAVAYSGAVQAVTVIRGQRGTIATAHAVDTPVIYTAPGFAF